MYHFPCPVCIHAHVGVGLSHRIPTKLCVWKIIKYNIQGLWILLQRTRAQSIRSQKLLHILDCVEQYLFFFFFQTAIKLFRPRETMQMVLHYEPIRIRRLVISSFLRWRWHNPISGFPSNSPTHLSLTTLSLLSDSPLRSCSFYEKGCSTLIPTICVRSAATAKLSTIRMPWENLNCDTLLSPTIPESSNSSESGGGRSSLILLGHDAALRRCQICR